jgi:AraC-like DNA-binding protein
MQDFINTIHRLDNADKIYPFLIVNAKQEQPLTNTPIVNPSMIVVLKGEKHVGDQVFKAGEFVFIADSPKFSFRNIPIQEEYLAFCFEFKHEDFLQNKAVPPSQRKLLNGTLSQDLCLCLEQFAVWSSTMPEQMHGARRREIVQLLMKNGHEEILSMVNRTKLGPHIHSLLSASLPNDQSARELGEQLGLSEKTLQRRLKNEDTSIQEIKDQVKLGLGLFLIQGSRQSIAQIALQCGYSSQSRFSERFKQRFGISPSALRKTKMTE